MTIIGFILSISGWFMIFEAVDNENKWQALIGGLLLYTASAILWAN